MTNFEFATIIIGVFTILLAVYGAGLSTYIFIVQRRDNKPNIDVKMTNGIFLDGPPASMLFVSASNIGGKTVTLSNVGISLPNKRYISLLDNEGNIYLPHDLPSGKSGQIWINMKDLAVIIRREGLSGKVKLLGFYRDAVGTTYKSKPFLFNVEDWIAQKA